MSDFYNDYNGRTESSFPQSPGYPTPIPVDPAPKKRRSNGGRFAAVLCACLVTSSVAGFGGGYLAGTLSAPARTQSAEAQSAGTQSAAEPISNAARPTNAAPAEDGAMTVSQVVNAVSDSVVEIRTEVQSTNFFQQAVTSQAAGSGVILTEDGYIITNNHVVEGANSITVRLKNEESYPATLVGTDPQTDVAVIKIDAAGLAPAAIGDSSSMQVGDDAIAIGNPLGQLGGTVTNGIISATGRDVTIGGETMHLMQTNAAINPGNSGGGLFNNRGELIGIVVAKSSGAGIEGLGFAIPIDTAKAVADDLIANGYVTGRGELGVSVVDITDQQTAFYYRVPQLGVYVAGVQDGSAAQAAGLKVGDGIVAVGEKEVSGSAELKNALAGYKAGDAVELTILRDGGRLTVQATLQESVPESVKQRQKTFAA